MLWYKSWLDTRWRFAIGLVLLVVVSGGTVIDYAAMGKVIRSVGALDTTTEVGRRLKEAIEIESTYPGFVWWEWFRQNLPQIGTLFAVLLGSGSILANGPSAALFTLSLPISRPRLVGIRAATGLIELFAIAIVSSLMIPLMSLAIGQRYPLTDTIVYATCAFAGAAAFFSLALLFSTAFDDLWRPLLIACAAAILIGGCEVVLWNAIPYGPFHLMSGDVYFRTGHVPWIGLLASAAFSAGLVLGAASNLTRRDF